MNLRPYQQKAVDNIVADIAAGCGAMLTVLPTGAGKTIVFSHIAKIMQPKRVLILAHREELIDQAIIKLHAATGIFAQKEKAQHRASKSAPVVVGSVQSMVNRLANWPSDHFGLVICDEAHHSISGQWQKVLQHFTCPTLGVTATPDRGDKKNLGSFYEKVSFEIGLVELINQGFLCPIKVKSIPLEIDISSVKQKVGDFDANQLASALDPYLDSIADQIKLHAADRKILSFLPLIKTSEKFAAACNRAGISSMHVSGQSRNRAEILDAFAQDECQHLSNAMLLTEGYDQPDVDCLLILRPTRSRPLYSQMVGRGTRIDDFKSDLLLLDFLWNHTKHNLIKPANLIAGSDAIADTMTNAMARGGEMQMDLVEASTDAAVANEEKLAAKLEANAKRKVAEENVMDYCKSTLEMGAADFLPHGSRESGMTQRQSDVLERNGIDPSGVRGTIQASKMISAIFKRKDMGLASPKQVALLRRLKYPHPESATTDEAGEFLGKRFGNSKPSFSARSRTNRFYAKR